MRSIRVIAIKDAVGLVLFARSCFVALLFLGSPFAHSDPLPSPSPEPISESDEPTTDRPGLGIAITVGEGLHVTSSNANESLAPLLLIPTFYTRLGGRVDYYPWKVLSLETGLYSVSESMHFSVNTSAGASGTGNSSSGDFSMSQQVLQIPFTLRLWFAEGISLGGGPILNQVVGSTSCTASGALECKVPTIDYAQTGFKASYVSWLVSLSAKYRFTESGPIWLYFDLDYIRTPNIVQDASLAGGSFFGYDDVVFSASLRYRILGK